MQSQFMTAGNNSRMHLPFFGKSDHFPNASISLVSQSLCWRFLKTMITEDAILNFISTRVSGTTGNWFQCFPVYPGLNSSSGSGSGSGFLLFHTPLLSLSKSCLRSHSILTKLINNNWLRLHRIPVGSWTIAEGLVSYPSGSCVDLIKIW